MVDAILMMIDTPLILIDGDDLKFFKDVDRLLEYVEPVDVTDGVYSVFDASGRTIHLGIERKNNSSWLGSGQMPVVVSVTDDSERRELLRETLSRYVGGHQTGNTSDQDLFALIRQAAEAAGFTA
jgi:hypothetical protein